MEVPAHSGEMDFSPQKLVAFLRANVEGMAGSISFDRIGGGQSNPTYFVSSPQRKLVLRKRPEGQLAPGAHDVQREFRVQKALNGTDIPVPQMVLYYPEEDLVGTAFYLMEAVPSRQFYDALMPQLSVQDRRALYCDTAGHLARLHRLDWQQLGLGEFARDGSFVERQIRRWERAFEGSPDSSDAKRIASYLWQNLPSTERQMLIHGDYKFNNLLVHPTRPEIAAILDWELFTIGDPLLDLAHTCLGVWGTKPDEYGGVMGCESTDPDLPSEAEFLEAYYRVNPDMPEFSDFYRLLAILRLAGIYDGIRQRAEQGNASAANAAETGKLGRVYLDRGLELL